MHTHKYHLYSLTKGIKTKIDLFRHHAKNSMEEYDSDNTIFVRVNAHGSVEDVYSFVEAFAEAGRVLQSGDYDNAFTVYGEAARLAVR